MDKETLEKFLKQAATKPIYKPYLPFFKLALDSYLAQNKIISYWTLCYIVETALKNHPKPGDDIRKLLMEIMTVMEKEKARTDDPLFANEKEAKKFIEEYGKKLTEKAEENEELLENFDVAYKLYLSATNIFEMYTVFVKDDPENAKRIKFCKWRAVENFKKKKEAAENPKPAPPPAAPDSVDDQEDFADNTAGSAQTQPGISGIPESQNDPVCPYPTGGPPPGECPYPTASGNSPYPAPSSSIDSNPASEFDPFAPGKSDPGSSSTESETKPVLPPVPAPRTTPPPAATDSKPPEQKLKETLAAMKLTESDSKRAELLCESALYAIKAEDYLTAVETLQQTLELIHKRARK